MSETLDSVKRLLLDALSHYEEDKLGAASAGLDRICDLLQLPYGLPNVGLGLHFADQLISLLLEPFQDSVAVHLSSPSTDEVAMIRTGCPTDFDVCRR